MASYEETNKIMTGVPLIKHVQKLAASNLPNAYKITSSQSRGSSLANVVHLVMQACAYAYAEKEYETPADSIARYIETQWATEAKKRLVHETTAPKTALPEDTQIERALDMALTLYMDTSSLQNASPSHVILDEGCKKTVRNGVFLHKSTGVSSEEITV